MINRRKRFPEEDALHPALSKSVEEAFTITFADLTFIMLAFFVFLDALAVPDAILRSGVLDSLSSHFVHKMKSPDEAAKTSSGIIAIAEKAKFQVVKENDRYILTIPSTELFLSGDDQIISNVRPILEEIATIVKNEKLFVMIEGHTDNRPIHTHRFPSNWELSAARAASVLRLFLEQGVSAEHLAAAGRAEFRPVESNETPEGRARNRRVVLIITGKEDK
jgi:chemotaxis protein MotB